MTILWAVLISVVCVLYFWMLLKTLRKHNDAREELREQIDAWVKSMEAEQAKLDAFNKKVARITRDEEVLDGLLDDLNSMDSLLAPSERTNYLITEEDEPWG